MKEVFDTLMLQYGVDSDYIWLHDQIVKKKVKLFLSKG